jgi:uncharacterized protein (TIGR02118 family)
MTTTVKTVDFMPRRKDISRADFRDHYEERHAPLAVPLFPFRRYRRNHLVDQGIEPGFDCVSEFWVSSIEAIGALMTGETGETMRADERKFLDQVANIAVRADSVLVDNDTGTRLLMIHDDGGKRDALIEACRKVGAGLDLLSPLDERTPPFAAIARIGDTAPSLPPGWRAGPTLSVTLAETDPATLIG